MKKEGKAAPTSALLSQVVREMVATVPWGPPRQRALVCDKPRRPPLLPARHRPFWLVAQCAAEPDQGQRLRARRDRKEDAQF